MIDMVEMMDNQSGKAVIKVMGVGGCGCNAVQQMANEGIDGVQLYSVNTDVQVLERSTVPVKVQIGAELTRGLGAGCNPEVGQAAAESDRERFGELLEGTDILFIAAGMGGGTGTGASPVVAQIAKDMGILTVAVVTRPFPLEGKKKERMADAGLLSLQNSVDSLITIPNGKLMNILGKKCTVTQAYHEANKVLIGAVQGISDLITKPGDMNVDFADVKTVMKEAGVAMMGTGRGRGENRAQEAAMSAIDSPFLDDIDLRGARGILVNITAGKDFGLGEFTDVMAVINDIAHEEATVKLGHAVDDSMEDELVVTVVATGIDAQVVKSQHKAPIQLIRPQAGNAGAGLTAGLSKRSSTEGTSLKAQSVPGVATAPASNAALDLSEQDADVSDIPAFLRFSND